MAALGTIRKRGVTLIIIIGLGLFAFIAEEMFRSCEATSNEKRLRVGEVLGESLSVQDFQNLIDEYQEVIKMTQGRDNLSENELNQIKDQVWETYVNNVILEKEAKKVGLTVTNEELQNILRDGTNPILLQTPFVNQQTRRFDVSLLTKFLDDYKKVEGGQNAQMAEQYRTIYKYWQFIEKSLRQQTLAMKYQNLLAGCLLSNPICAKMTFDGQSTEKDILLASMAYSTINDNDVTVSDADLQAKYNEEKEMFKQYVESRDIKYVEFQVKASPADRKEILATVTTAQKQLADGGDPAEIVRKAQSQYAYIGLPVTRKAFPTDIAAKIDSMAVGQTTAPFETKMDNTFNVIKLISKAQMPDSVEYRQIQIIGNTVDEARKTADSVYTALKAGAPFDSIAKKYNQTAESQWLTSAMYENSQTIDADSKKYLQTITTLGENEISNIEFMQGNVIVQVLSRKAMVDKYLAAVVKHTIDFSKNTYSAAYNKFSQFVSANQTVEDMEKNAAKFGFKVQERKDLFNTEHTIAGISSTGDAMKWIFDAKVGSVSPLYECGANDHLLVVAMTKVHPVGYRALEDVKDLVKSEVVRDKKYDMLKDKLTGVNNIAAAKAKGARIDTVRQITFSAPVFVSATGASEPALSGAVVATKKGAFCSRAVKGNAGVYMFQVTDQKTRQGAKFDDKLVEQQLRQQAMQAASRFMNELYLKAGVIDNRYMFF